MPRHAFFCVRMLTPHDLFAEQKLQTKRVFRELAFGSSPDVDTDVAMVIDVDLDMNVESVIWIASQLGKTQTKNDNL